MISILNEYSPINPPSMSSQPNSDNDLIINSTLPARKTVNIYGVWDGLEFSREEFFWTPSSIAKISNPAITVDGLGEDTYTLKTPDYPEISVSDSEYVALKGFATKETVEEFLENTLMPNGEFSEYFYLLADEWNIDNLANYITDADGNFEFSEDKYSEAGFLFELLFECGGAIYPVDSNGIITFPTSANMDNQDMFAIYERKQHTYTFYYPDGSSYETESVYYGEHPSDPIRWSQKPLPTSGNDTRYRLYNRTITSQNPEMPGNVVEWYSVEDDSSTGGQYVYKKRLFDVNAAWRETTDQTNTAISLDDYTAGTGVTSFTMRLTYSVPILFVIDGVPEGYPGSYGYGNGWKTNSEFLQNWNTKNASDGKYCFYDYDNDEPMQVNLSDNLFRSSTLYISDREVQGGKGPCIKDTSPSWFYDASCYTDRVSEYNTSEANRIMQKAAYLVRIKPLDHDPSTNSPIFVYHRTTPRYILSFDPDSELDQTKLVFDDLAYCHTTWSYADHINCMGRTPDIYNEGTDESPDYKIYYTKDVIYEWGTIRWYNNTQQKSTVVNYWILSAPGEVYDGDWGDVNGDWRSAPYGAGGYHTVLYSDVVISPNYLDFDKPKVRISRNGVIVDSNKIIEAGYTPVYNQDYVDVVANAATVENLWTYWDFQASQWEVFRRSDLVKATTCNPLVPRARSGEVASVEYIWN